MSRFFAAAATGLAMLALATAAAADPTRVPLDQETQVGGIPVACTGIGQTKDDPKWKAYSVRIEFANPKSAYFAGEDVTLTAPNGDTVADVSCEGAWLLLNLPPGKTYKAEARLTDPPTAPRTAAIAASGKGQKTVVMVFPDAN